MLLRFHFSNYRSFRDEQELSLVASSLEDIPSGAVAVPGIKEKALRVCGLYGANASGKTTVFRALQFLETAVRESHRYWEPEGGVPLKMFRGSNGGQSKFDIDFVDQGIRFQYGFVANPQKVEREWLFSYPSGRKQVWFLRKDDKPIVFGRSLQGENKMIASLTRSNSLFLSAAAQNNHDALFPVYRWLTASLVFVFNHREVSGVSPQVFPREENREMILEFLSVADLGVDDLEVELKEVDHERERKIREAIKPFFQFQDEPEMKEKKWRSSVKLYHRLGNDSVPFETRDESDGTIAYLSLLGPIVEALNHGTALIVDELDSSLHPLLATHIIRLFNNQDTNPKSAQLIFNTHDTNLLASGLLRRDQIWFTEKDREGASHLYPLTDFKPRRDENLQKGYLQGRYGAIPFIHSEAVLEGVTSDAQPG